MSTTTGVGGGNSIGYKELFLDKNEGGQSLNETIAERFSQMQKQLKEVQDDPGNAAKLMTLQVSMNSLQQVMSTTTQLINSMKSMTEGINRNI